QGPADFSGLLAQPGEHHLGGIAAGGQDPLQFAHRNNIKTRAQAGQYVQNRQVGVGFDGETDQMGKVSQSFVIGQVMLFQGGAGVDIARAAVLAGNLADRYVLGKQLAVSVLEMIHGEAHSDGSWSSTGFWLVALSPSCCWGEAWSRVAGGGRYRSPFCPQPDSRTSRLPRAAATR